MSTIFYAKLCSLLARRRSSQPVQRAYWPENVIDWLGKWRPTYVMRYACGHKLQRFRLKISFWSHHYSVTILKFVRLQLFTGQNVFTRSWTNSCPKSFTKLCCRNVVVILTAFISMQRDHCHLQNGDLQMSKIIVIKSQLLKNPFSIHF